jgi:hypothetical protein
VTIGNVAGSIVAHHKELLTIGTVWTFAGLLNRCRSSSPHPTSNAVAKLLPTVQLNIGERFADTTLAYEKLTLEVPSLVHCPTSRIVTEYNLLHTVEPPGTLAWKFQSTSVTSHSTRDTAAKLLKFCNAELFFRRFTKDFIDGIKSQSVQPLELRLHGFTCVNALATFSLQRFWIEVPPDLSFSKVARRIIT